MEEKNTIKTIIEVKNNKITFTCEPNDEVEVYGYGRTKRMKRAEAVKYFWETICMGDSIEVEEGAYGLINVLNGSKKIDENPGY